MAKRPRKTQESSKGASSSKTKSAGTGGSRRGRQSLSVRMYRQGLGDCFLLTLPSNRAQPFYMMIDCGVILGTRDATTKMKAVVEDIVATTGGQIDLLVVTHEHWDHVSGFIQARQLFAEGEDDQSAGKLHIRDLWLAWTEDPDDHLATLLRGQRMAAERGLRLAVQGLRGAEAEAADGAGQNGLSASEQVDSLLGFFGARSGSTAEALAAVRVYAQHPPRFCRPADPPLELEATPGFRFYVLGPPEDEKLLKRSRPSRADSEVYEALHLTPETAFFDGVEARFSAVDVQRDDEWDAGAPAGRRYRIPEHAARQLPFFQEHYWGDAVGADYTDQSWRRIDTDWLEAAAELALKLDEDTNNTSLVLAIEHVETGRVLLLPGDAQVGNWLSWENVSWTLGDGTRVSAHDLLRRTVLYKVGHHGSHNATLREKGLELMSHPDLCALVPVDHEMAKKKRWSQIPFEPLLKRLAQRARGRVLRADCAEPVASWPRPADISDRNWQEFLGSVRETALYLECKINA